MVAVEPVPFQPHRFRTAAAHYLLGRPAYAPRAIARVAQLCRLNVDDRLLDLGCGPGQLARAFAPWVAEVVGIDPEPEMLRIAGEDSPANANWIQGSSYDLGPHLGRFKLVTMGRSFHWMDRVDTLRRLDQIVAADGVVALFSADHPEMPDNAWRAEYRAILNHYAERDTGRHKRGPGWVPHSAVLLDSPFSVIEELSVIERRRLAAPVLVERALSMSSTSRAILGDRSDDFIRELTALVERLAPTDMLIEVVATTALMARRSAA